MKETRLTDLWWLAILIIVIALIIWAVDARHRLPRWFYLLTAICTSCVLSLVAFEWMRHRFDSDLLAGFLAVGGAGVACAAAPHVIRPRIAGDDDDGR